MRLGRGGRGPGPPLDFGPRLRRRLRLRRRPLRAARALQSFACKKRNQPNSKQFMFPNKCVFLPEQQLPAQERSFSKLSCKNHFNENDRKCKKQKSGLLSVSSDAWPERLRSS